MMKAYVLHSKKIPSKSTLQVYNHSIHKKVSFRHFNKQFVCIYKFNIDQSETNELKRKQETSYRDSKGSSYHRAVFVQQRNTYPFQIEPYRRTIRCRYLLTVNSGIQDLDEPIRNTLYHKQVE